MKLQGLSIIFGLMIIPIVLVVSYYIQMQVDTITLQTEYDSKLLDATHDAMVSFELNTANEDLSSVADSLRTIIDASTNVFVNTLATNLGLSNASKSRIEPYIPAILYTLYDGYYINSPTRKPEIAKQNNGIVVIIDEGVDPTTNKANKKFSVPGLSYSGGKYTYDPDSTTYSSCELIPAEDYGEMLYKLKDGTYTTNINDPNISYKTEFVLKTYMPYTARYVKNDIDVTINYTLDNYLNIEGSIGNVYYTKSGYLISKTKSDEILNSISEANLKDYNENEAEENIKAIVESGGTVSVTVDGQTIATNGSDGDRTSAVIYYVKSAIFSNWIYNNLGTLQEKDIKQEVFTDTVKQSDADVASGEKGLMVTTTSGETSIIVHDFSESDATIFNSSTDPENNVSTFVNHKYLVIRNSIQYNLNLSLSTYNDETVSTYDFAMPIISETEWGRILSNISIVSFMQGLNCGLKTYNNYAIVNSTNNELTVIPNEIYYVRKEEFNNESGIYHRIDCPVLKEYLEGFTGEHKELLSFKSKEVKYDKVYDKTEKTNKYDHKNYACYTCIVDGNYEPAELTDDEKLEYNIAIGKERNNLYKLNSIKYSEGYEVIFDKESKDVVLHTEQNSSRPKSDMKTIEITFGNIDCTDREERVVRVSVPGLNNEVYVLNTNQAKEQTLTIPVHFNSSNNNKLNANTIKNCINNINNPTVIRDEHGDVSVPIRNAVKSVRIVYK